MALTKRAGMETRTLAHGGPIVSALGLGCMGMSGGYGPAQDAESLRTLERALELGITLFDTADSYGVGHNETLLGPFVRRHRARVVLATKFGMVRNPDGTSAGICGTPAYVRSACEASLKRLGIETIDLYYQHRVDPNVPIEETVGAMRELVAAGKIREIGLSEATAAEVCRAAAVYPIAAYEGEYSLFSRDHEDDGVIAMLRELGIPLVAYSPISRGWLSGTLHSLADIAPGDMRASAPRWQPDTFDRNKTIAAEVVAIADQLGVTAAQLALAWVRARGDNVIPIPGTRTIRHLEENVAALEIRLTPQQQAQLEATVSKDAVAGTRGMGGLRRT
jgi:aryl-alcohol dehydrogenase-like predicted oxidoreductase